MFPAWLTEVVLITVRDMGWGLGPLKFKGNANKVGSFPAPADYLATFLIFTPLAFLADTQAKNLATAIGWGYVLGTLLGALDPSDPLGKATSQTAATVNQSTATQTAASVQPNGGK